MSRKLAVVPERLTSMPEVLSDLFTIRKAFCRHWRIWCGARVSRISDWSRTGSCWHTKLLTKCPNSPWPSQTPNKKYSSLLRKFLMITVESWLVFLVLLECCPARDWKEYFKLNFFDLNDVISYEVVELESSFIRDVLRLPKYARGKITFF